MEHEKPLVSVVLPVYNGERFLGGAIDSILNQSYCNWELLVVDDGSNDGSPVICDEYAVRDSRIKVYHQPNGGVNSARAKGVDNATGTYLAFLDADDFFCPDALALWVSTIRREDDILVTGKQDIVLDHEMYIRALWKGEIGPELWGKLFLTSFYKKIKYSIDRRLVMGEDLLLNSLYALRIKQARQVSRQLYHVNRNNEESVTKTFKHNWEYEKYYFKEIEELFLNECTSLDSFDRVQLLVNKSWLNAMKYTLLDGGKINYKDIEFQKVREFFSSRKDTLGPSESLLLNLRNPVLYRLVLKTYLAIKG